MIRVGDREFMAQAIYERFGLYYCAEHAPAGVRIVGPIEVRVMVERHVACDLEAEAARGNRTSFPVRPPECATCEERLFAENRPARPAN